jgi:hypothetical protein
MLLPPLWWRKAQTRNCEIALILQPNNHQDVEGLLQAIKSLYEAQVTQFQVQSQVIEALQARVVTLEAERPALVPVDSLLRLYLQQNLGDFHVLREVRLNGQPSTLKELVDHFKKDNGKYDEYMVVWITDGAFVR